MKPIVKVTLAVVFAVAAVVIYQNCGMTAGGGGSPFQVSSTTGNLSAGVINFTQSAYAPSSHVSASATVTSDDPNVTCSWTVSTGATNVGSYTSMMTSGTCTTPAALVAPSSMGYGILILSVANSAGTGTQTAGSFSVSATAPTPTPAASASPGVSPTPVPSPTATPPPYYYTCGGNVNYPTCNYNITINCSCTGGLHATCVFPSGTYCSGFTVCGTCH